MSLETGLGWDLVLGLLTGPDTVNGLDVADLGQSWLEICQPSLVRSPFFFQTHTPGHNWAESEINDLIGDIAEYCVF